jgi:hypothetical protein
MIDLVIGAAWGYSAEQIKPFVRSLQLSDYRGDVVIFADGEAAEEIQWHGYETRDCPDLKTKPHADRFHWIYEELLKKERELDTGILVTDTRDVIFQMDPNVLPGYGVNAYSEDSSQTIGSCPYNSNWMEIGYGAAELERVKDRPISCVGSVCGNRLNMLVWLRQLCEALKEKQPLTQEPQDQSCHNYLLNRPECPYKLWTNEDAGIYTVGYIPRETVEIKDGYIVNKAGRIPSVVHQWDRHQNLTALVDDKYR